MNQKQEKDIIRVLAQAGKQDLAQTFARSRGYGIKGEQVHAVGRRPLFGALIRLNLALNWRASGELSKLISVSSRAADAVHKDWDKIVRAWQSPKATYPSPARMKKFQELLRAAADKYKGHEPEDIDRWWDRKQMDKMLDQDRKQLREQKKQEKLQQKQTASYQVHAMNQKQEKDMIRVLAQAGKQELAQTFARSRGYRVHAQKALLDKLNKTRQTPLDQKQLDEVLSAGYNFSKVLKKYFKFDSRLIAMAHGIKIIDL